MKRIILFAILLSLSLSFAQSVCNSNDSIPVYELQGSGRRSPYAGKIVSTQAVVTAVYPGSGFFIQDLKGDDDASTSDGIFVRITSRSEYVNTKIEIGDLVFVSGKLLERNELSQLGRLKALEVCGRSELPKVSITLPLKKVSDWENFEGMRVKFEQELTVAETYNLARYGQVLLSLGRLYQPNNGQNNDDNSLRQILMDDNSNVENPKIVPFLNDGYLRLGSTISGLEGIVVNAGLGKYLLEPIHAKDVKFTNSNPRTPHPDRYIHEITVASFNVLNYFKDLNERGADSPEEFERQTAKLLAALSSIEADVFGLIEIENDANDTVALLTEKLNQHYGRRHYAYVPKPPLGLGSDQIRQAIIYDPNKLKLLSYGSKRNLIFDRPPVSATFKSLSDGEIFSVIVSHLKSKGGCPPAGDLDRGFGCWNLRRSAQAQKVADYAEFLGRLANDKDVLLLGDFNSYRMEPPIATIEKNGFTNLDIMLELADRYSYVYKGELGSLDYGFASPTILPQISGFDIWHINSDEARMLDYNTEFNPAYLYKKDAYRSSDHDPVIIYLTLE